MKQTITQSMFIDDMRAVRPDNFSYEGLVELFNYLDDIDTELEFDPIGICCQFSQCSLKEFMDSYIETDGTMTEEETRDTIQDHIELNGFWFAFVEGGKEVVFENF
jgi:hypothetical protein